MADLMKLVRTYRLTAGLSERLRLTDQICTGVAPLIGPYIGGFARRSDIEDIVQEALISIADNLDNFKKSTEEEFGGWCRTIARRRLSDHYRKNKSNRLEFWNPEIFSDLIDASEPASAELREELEYALALLDKSKPECRHYLWKRFADNFKPSKIAKELGIKPNAARMRVTRCLEEVRKILGIEKPIDSEND